MAVSHIHPREVPDATVALVQFLVDALQSDRITPSMESVTPVQVVTSLLVKFSWHFRLVPVDIVIQFLYFLSDFIF